MIYVIPVSPAVFWAVFHHIGSFSSELIHVPRITSIKKLDPRKSACVETDRQKDVWDVKFIYSAKENSPIRAPPALIAPVGSDVHL